MAEVIVVFYIMLLTVIILKKITVLAVGRHFYKY
nr:MAG TPA: hypothetical protein [Caudoviricetes sp.]